MKKIMRGIGVIGAALILATPILPRSDIAPSRRFGCSLGSTAFANVPPPPEDCQSKKIGDTCQTRWGTDEGTCQEVCYDGTRPECLKKPNNVHLVCAAEKAKDCDPKHDKNCAAKTVTPTK